jgi:hypothetical protein
MCPQRLFTNTKLFMIAGKRNLTRAQSSPDLAGGAGAGEPRGGRLFFRFARGEAAVRSGRGATGPERWAPAAAATAFVFEAPRGSSLGLPRAWRVYAPPTLSPATRRAFLPRPSSLHPVFLSSTRPGKNSQFLRKRNPLRELRFQTKAATTHNSESPIRRWF